MELSSKHAKWMDYIIQSRWAKDGDRGTKLFYKSFKELSTDKGISELFGADGAITSGWEDMAAISTGFFSNILGDSAEAVGLPSDEEWEEVLSAQHDCLTAEEKTALNAPLTLEELGMAVAALSNDKCPGLDGTPNEFYKMNWPVVGPLVLNCISEGIEAQAFPKFVTRGAIVLLPKKADQRYLSNKRPITLLNSIYKIGAKAMQLRVTPILQRTLTSQQTAFLPGRNIHHGLLLMSEMLHRAKASGENRSYPT